jgi:hypothetical protein
VFLSASAGHRPLSLCELSLTSPTPTPTSTYEEAIRRRQLESPISRCGSGYQAPTLFSQCQGCIIRLLTSDENHQYHAFSMGANRWGSIMDLVRSNYASSLSRNERLKMQVGSMPWCGSRRIAHSLTQMSSSASFYPTEVRKIWSRERVIRQHRLDKAPSW